jgi:pantoate--beta-alanine ligase
MKVIHTKKELNEFLFPYRNSNKTIGFVPTMGALHTGHLSLVEISAKSCDITIMSIFVNPTQFNDIKDFEKYPQNLTSDIEKLKSSPCDIVFAPNANEIYENGLNERIIIDLKVLNTILEGEKRPGHYDGVVTVVYKLFNIVQPNKVFLGMKDYQQVLVIKELIKQKQMPIEAIGCPTLREPNGLAMSSRNTRLSEDEKEIALNLSKALHFIISQVGKSTPKIAITSAIKQYLTNPHIRLEYLQISPENDISIEINDWEEADSYVVLIAAFVGNIRLIDNMVFSKQ